MRIQALLLLAILAGCGLPPVAVSGTVEDILSSNPVPGSEVCLYEEDKVPCVTTDVDGAFTLPEVDADSDVRLHFGSIGDYLPSIAMFHTQEEANETIEFALITELQADLQATLVGTTIEPTKGILAVGAVDARATSNGSVPGVSHTLSPGAGEGPFYLDDSGIPDENLLSTSTSGFGIWVNLDPGDYTVTYAYPDGSCAPWFSWTDGAVEASTATIVAGTVTYVSMVCQ